MRKRTVILASILPLFMPSMIYAALLKLNIESYDPAVLETVSKIINVSDTNDQLEISGQAALFALSAAGWNLGALDFSLDDSTFTPPDWSDSIYALVSDPLDTFDSVQSQVLGYDLNQEAFEYGPVFLLFFHTDRTVERLLHNIGEAPNNYGVISGGMGGEWIQMHAPEWGRFWTESVSVPVPAAIWLLGTGLIGIVGIRRKLKKD